MDEIGAKLGGFIWRRQRAIFERQFFAIGTTLACPRSLLRASRIEPSVAPGAE